MTVATNDNQPSTNMFGGDTDWGDAPTSELDRGDAVDAVEPENADDATDPLTDIPADDPEDDVEEAADEPEDDVEEPEEVSESEDEPEGQVDEKPKGEKAKKDKNGMVPRSRLNKEIQKRQDLEARIKQLENGRQTPAEPRAPAAPKEPIKPNQEAVTGLLNSLLDGNESEAAAKLEELLQDFGQKVFDQAVTESRELAEGAVVKDKAQAELQKAADEVVAEYPEFDSTSESHDLGLMEEVVAMRDLLMNRGETPANALRRAAKLVALENGLKPTGKKNALADVSVKSKPKDVKAQIEKAQKTPGRLTGAGDKNRETKIDVLAMSDDQFSKLSKEALARARGDFI